MYKLSLFLLEESRILKEYSDFIFTSMNIEINLDGYTFHRNLVSGTDPTDRPNPNLRTNRSLIPATACNTFPIDFLCVAMKHELTKVVFVILSIEGILTKYF